MHSNVTIYSNTSLRSLFSKMCVFGDDGLELLSPIVSIAAKECPSTKKAVKKVEEQ